MQCILVDIQLSILEQAMDTMVLVLGTMELGFMGWVWVILGLGTMELDRMMWAWVIMGWHILEADIMQWVWDTMGLGSMMTLVTQDWVTTLLDITLLCTTLSFILNLSTTI